MLFVLILKKKKKWRYERKYIQKFKRFIIISWTLSSGHTVENFVFKGFEYTFGTSAFIKVYDLQL